MIHPISTESRPVDAPLELVSPYIRSSPPSSSPDIPGDHDKRARTSWRTDHRAVLIFAPSTLAFLPLLSTSLSLSLLAMATPVDKKLLRQTKFPPEFNQKVDMTKVNIEVMKKCVIFPRFRLRRVSMLMVSLLQMDLRSHF